MIHDDNLYNIRGADIVLYESKISLKFRRE